MDQRLQSYTGERGDVLALVRGTPERSLDIGCSDGTLLGALGDRTETSSIELDPELAQAAAGRLDEVITGDAVELSAELSRSGRRFDLIICADILEHLAFPETVLDHVENMLELDGQVVVSLPT